MSKGTQGGGWPPLEDLVEGCLPPSLAQPPPTPLAQPPPTPLAQTTLPLHGHLSN